MQCMGNMKSFIPMIFKSMRGEFKWDYRTNCQGLIVLCLFLSGIRAPPPTWISNIKSVELLLTLHEWYLRKIYVTDVIDQQCNFTISMFDFTFSHISTLLIPSAFSWTELTFRSSSVNGLTKVKIVLQDSICTHSISRCRLLTTNRAERFIHSTVVC